MQRYAAAVLYLLSNKKLGLVPGMHECNFLGITCKDLPIPAISLEVTLSNYQQIDNTMGDDEGRDNLLVLPRHDNGTVDCGGRC